jgi:cytoplasmic iron level regulating protein YaaA (DUF328/UPF0246 family)
MLIITSPAKSLNLDGFFPKGYDSTAPFLAEAKSIASFCQSKSTAELKQLLKVSDKLTTLNFERYQDWHEAHTEENSRPALFTFKGDVFRQLELDTYGGEEFVYAQGSLLTLSGLYGILRAFDLMKPYRLEMGTKMTGFEDIKLPHFWKRHIALFLNEKAQTEKHTFILNLASMEYAEAVDISQLDIPLMSAQFKEYKDGKWKIVGIKAKRARGMMINYCIQNKVTSLDEVKQFDVGGYEVVEESCEGVVFGRR